MYLQNIFDWRISTMEPTWAEAIGVLVIVAIIVIIPIVSCLRAMVKHDREVDELYKREF